MDLDTEFGFGSTVGAPPIFDVNFNSTLEGQANAISPLNVNLTDGVGFITPTSVALTGNDLNIEAPPYELDLTDRFGNAFSTVNIQGNPNVDLRTLTPYDWADIYLSRLTNPPTGAQETAVITFFDNMINAGIFQGSTKIELDIGGNAADHSWNARYPFDNNSSMRSFYVGSPTHNANGVSLNGTNQVVRTNSYVSYLSDFNKQISIYKRNTNFGGVVINAGNFNTPQGFGFVEDAAAGRTRFYAEGINVGPFATGVNGLWSLSRESSTVIKMRRNGVNDTASPHTGVAVYNNVSAEITIGAEMSQSLTFTAFNNLNYCYFRVGNALSNAQETDHYNIVQALQTALGRQV
jgi:hypothetical protein